ncbi:uncharacterized protein A1O9_06470 [Exophiala aquamarina CBS 119918]|uniref:Uncharacterized protein n=1 Tax=Exophiala aquamarina CBS 119918 TaxID=1182545 RepID=A0A072PEK3_9EURO|nr:uncharacterized protein A1O9_06470 [Exophiala aquamarina CBS 119918]KEF58544.1 hypothetical protein A1O9_06470 [Exophiala aquamarina CBS 119918]
MQVFWPEPGGIDGQALTNLGILTLAEEIRDMYIRAATQSLKIETAARADVEAGVLKLSWIPHIGHPSILADHNTREPSQDIIAGALIAAAAGSWTVSDEWNKLLQDVKLTTGEECLRNHVWEGIT